MTVITNTSVLFFPYRCSRNNFCLSICRCWLPSCLCNSSSRRYCLISMLPFPEAHDFAIQLTLFLLPSLGKLDAFPPFSNLEYLTREYHLQSVLQSDLVIFWNFKMKALKSLQFKLQHSQGRPLEISVGPLESQPMIMQNLFLF